MIRTQPVRPKLNQSTIKMMNKIYSPRQSLKGLVFFELAFRFKQDKPQAEKLTIIPAKASLVYGVSRIGP